MRTLIYHLFMPRHHAHPGRRAGHRRPGRRDFENRCARCHGADATGGESGPGIVTQIASRSDTELAVFLREGRPAKGMPAFPLANDEMTALVSYARSLGADVAQRAARDGAPKGPDHRRTARSKDRS